MNRAASALSARPAVILGVLALFVVLAGLVGWGAMTTISGAVIAPGRVEVEQNRQVVQHPDGGVVARLAVAEAQSVAAGDLLIVLDGSLLQSERAIVEAQLFEAMAHRARLEAERDGAAVPAFPAELTDQAASRPDVAALLAGQRNLFDARAQTLRKQVEQLEQRQVQIAAQVEGIRAQEAALSRQIELIGQELTDQRSLLARGLAQAGRVLALEREAASLQGALGEAVAARAQAEGRSTEVALEVLRLADMRREEAATGLREIAPREAELAERRRSIEQSLSRLEIRAPVSGLVLGLQVLGTQAVIRPADPLLYIVPQDRPLIVTARLSPLDIDEVQPGQPVRLRLPSLPGRTTPEIEGQVTNISADALVDPDGQTSYYRAEIRLDPAAVAKLEGQRLVPGMPVEAFIQTRDRTPLAYLLQPFTDYFHMAFRES